MEGCVRRSLTTDVVCSSNCPRDGSRSISSSFSSGSSSSSSSDSNSSVVRTDLARVGNRTGTKNTFSSTSVSESCRSTADVNSVGNT